MEREYFSMDEEEELKKLLAKQKRIQRAKKADEKFFQQVSVTAKWDHIFFLMNEGKTNFENITRWN